MLLRNEASVLCASIESLEQSQALLQHEKESQDEVIILLRVQVRQSVIELEEKESHVQNVHSLEGEKLRALREDLEHERAEREEQKDTERDAREKVVEERNQMVQHLEEQRLQQEVIEKRLIEQIAELTRDSQSRCEQYEMCITVLGEGLDVIQIQSKYSAKSESEGEDVIRALTELEESLSVALLDRSDALSQAVLLKVQVHERDVALEEMEARVQNVYSLEGEKLRAVREELENERAEREEEKDTERDAREKAVEERNQMIQRLEEQQQQQVSEKWLVEQLAELTRHSQSRCEKQDGEETAAEAEVRTAVRVKTEAETSVDAKEEAEVDMASEVEVPHTPAACSSTPGEMSQCNVRHHNATYYTRSSACLLCA